jgi:hypothetical protein
MTLLVILKKYGEKFDFVSGSYHNASEKSKIKMTKIY